MRAQRGAAARSPRLTQAPLLAIETATEDGSLALVRAGQVLAERALGRADRHAAALLPALEALLAGCGVDPDEVGDIAVSAGPGSFTGMRVGLATALGLCFGTARHIIPVPTLAALSLQAGQRPRIAPALDAHRGQLYTGLYGPAAEPLAPDRALDPGPWLESLRGLGPVAFLGSGALRHADAIRSVLGAAAELLTPEQGTPRAASVGLLGERLAALGAARAPQEAELFYLRTPAAEERRAAPLDMARRNS